MDPEILQYFPLAILQTIENAGHWLHAEQPDQIFERISDFFEKINHGISHHLSYYIT